MLRSLPNQTSPFHIAPCGLDCRLCMAYMREKKACPGCRGEEAGKARTCLTCKIKNCPKLASGGFTYCYECADFPCFLIARLDKRYRSRYATSAIGNLLAIKEGGIDSFVESENEKWPCPGCGALLSMHKAYCFACGYSWRT